MRTKNIKPQNSSWIQKKLLKSNIGTEIYDNPPCIMAGKQTFSLGGKYAFTEVLLTPKSRGRKAAIPKPLPFPYDSGQDGLVKISKAIQADIAIRKKDITEICAWLPTIGGIPLASSPLVAENPDTEKEPSSAPWFIKSLP